MRWRSRCSVVALWVALSCDGAGRDDVGHGGAADAGDHAGSHTNTTPAKPSRSGAGGAPAVITCGVATCRATAMFAACCVDATHGTCGVQNETVGVACGVPATADPDCPPVNIMFAGSSITAQGCCTAHGVCGGFNLGSPCALVSVGDDADGGDAPPARACHRSQ